MGALREVFITGAGAYLPGEPVGCEAIEDHIGRVGGRDSLLGRRALRWNGVKTRHYAIAACGSVTDSNAGMCAKAVRRALDDAGLGLEALGYFAAAPTQGGL